VARYPAAQWRPIPVNYTPASISPNLLIEHIMEGTLSGTDAWFRNPAAQASAHFGVGKDGTVYQWVDTSDVAWHAANANGRSIGVEHEGYSGQALTPAQLNATAKILAWAAGVHPVPLVLAANSSSDGLAWHGLGGATWGNHPDCPGPPIVAQLPAILAQAQGGSPPSPAPVPFEEEDMMLSNGPGAATVIRTADGAYKWIGFVNDSTYPPPGRPVPVLRVAMHTGKGKSGKWATQTLTCQQSNIDWLNLPAGCNGVSITRAGGDAGDSVPVGYVLGN
jgi:hypothetical protein